MIGSSFDALLNIFEIGFFERRGLFLKRVTWLLCDFQNKTNIFSIDNMKFNFQLVERELTRPELYNVADELLLQPRRQFCFGRIA